MWSRRSSLSLVSSCRALKQMNITASFDGVYLRFIFFFVWQDVSCEHGVFRGCYPRFRAAQPPRAHPRVGCSSSSGSSRSYRLSLRHLILLLVIGHLRRTRRTLRQNVGLLLVLPYPPSPRLLDLQPGSQQVDRGRVSRRTVRVRARVREEAVRDPPHLRSGVGTLASEASRVAPAQQARVPQRRAHLHLLVRPGSPLQGALRLLLPRKATGERGSEGPGPGPDGRCEHSETWPASVVRRSRSRHERSSPTVRRGC